MDAAGVAGKYIALKSTLYEMPAGFEDGHPANESSDRANTGTVAHWHWQAAASIRK